MSTRLEELKKRFAEQRKPFPLSHLLYLYEISRSQDTYINYMEGFRLLAEWLAPIELPSSHSTIYKLQNSYELQQIAVILNTHPGIIQNGYQTTTAILQQSASST